MFYRSQLSFWRTMVCGIGDLLDGLVSVLSLGIFCSQFGLKIACSMCEAQEKAMKREEAEI